MPLIVILIFCCGLIANCTNSFKMIPARVQNDPNTIKSVAIGGLSGVNIIVKAGEWDGDGEVLEKITPVRVALYNNTGKPLKIEYSKFSFQGKKTYAAMPPYEIMGTVKAPSIVLPYPFPVKTVIEFNSEFRVAPHCARMYPQIPAYKEPFFIDINYYNRYYSRWARIKLPTVEMLSWLIPDGVIGDQGYVSGYLYFEKVSSLEKQVEFCMEITDAKSEKIIGHIRIPFNIIKE